MQIPKGIQIPRAKTKAFKTLTIVLNTDTQNPASWKRSSIPQKVSKGLGKIMGLSSIEAKRNQKRTIAKRESTKPQNFLGLVKEKISLKDFCIDSRISI